MMHGNKANNAQNCTKRSEFMFVGVRNSEESRAITVKLVIFQRPFIHFSRASCVPSVQHLCSAFFECFLIISFWQTSRISFNDAHCTLTVCGSDVFFLLLISKNIFLLLCNCIKLQRQILAHQKCRRKIYFLADALDFFKIFNC